MASRPLRGTRLIRTHVAAVNIAYYNRRSMAKRYPTYVYFLRRCFLIRLNFYGYGFASFLSTRCRNTVAHLSHQHKFPCHNVPSTFSILHSHILRTTDTRMYLGLRKRDLRNTNLQQIWHDPRRSCNFITVHDQH